MRFTRVEFPGEAAVSLTGGLNILGGLDASARRRWLDGLTGHVPARIWVDDAETPVSDPGSSPLIVEAMVVRREDLVRARPPIVPATPPPAVTDPAGADPSAVAAALATWRDALAVAGGRSEEAALLAAEWERVSAALAAEPELARDDQEKIEAARHNLDRALEAVARARQAYGSAGLAPETVTVAHRLHDEVVAAQEQASRRFAGAKVRARLSAALEEESRFLATMGVSSYTAFLLDVVDRPTDPEIARRVQVAEKEAQDAETTWRALGVLGAQARERAHLEHQFEVLRQRVGDLLGGGAPAGDVPSVLRAWPGQAPEVEATRRNLEAELRAVGVDPGPDAADAAADWLSACSERSGAGDEHAEQPPAGPDTDPDQIELYLLRRVAAQTREGGSFPLVFDDALDGLPEPVVNRALAVIQQAAASLQVIYLTADSDDQQVDLSDGPAGVAVAAAPVAAAPVAPEAPASPARAHLETPAVAAPKLAWCSPGSHHAVVEACTRCQQPVCDEHLVRTRTTFPSLCPSCALEVAGVARGRRRR